MRVDMTKLFDILDCGKRPLTLSIATNQFSEHLNFTPVCSPSFCPSRVSGYFEQYYLQRGHLLEWQTSS